MKVLQVNCVYNKGSTGKITHDLHAGLKKKGVDSMVCYGRGDLVQEDEVIRVCNDIYAQANKAISMVSGLMYGGCHYSTRKIEHIIKKEKPDIVHLQCINGNFLNIYKFISWLNKTHQKTVLTLHAEFMFTANCGYALCEEYNSGCKECKDFRNITGSIFLNRTNRSWELMREAFTDFENLMVTAVSPWLMERAKKSIIFGGKTFETVLNGLDTGIFRYYHKEEIESLILQYNLKGKKIIFHATPYFTNDINYIKGGYYIIEMAKRHPEMVFVVAGDIKKDLQLPVNMIMLGKVSEQLQLAKWYSLSDVTLLASRWETFSMVVAESLCCGTHVVGFEAGGPETIAILEYADFVKYGDIEAMDKAICLRLETEYNKELISKKAKLVYSSDAMVKRYIHIYKMLIGDV